MEHRSTRGSAPESRTLPGRIGLGLWAVAVLFFGVGDVATTTVGLGVDGIVEAGPITAVLVRQYGFAGIVLSKLATLGGCYLLWAAVPRPHRVGVPLGLAVVGVSATVWNAHVLALALAS